MSSGGLERLDAWRKAKDFALTVYREVIPLLPPEEKWSLGVQLRRSAQSIPANLAEGYGRFYYQENVHFCYIARGSLQETMSHLILAHELGFIQDSVFHRLVSQGNDLLRVTNGYIGYLKQTRQEQIDPGTQHHIRELGCDYEPVSYDYDHRNDPFDDSRFSTLEYRPHEEHLS